MIQETKKIKSKPLYIELEKLSDEQVKELERVRVEKLKEIKAQHQPVSKDEITSHARKYEEVIRQKREELRLKRGGLELITSHNPSQAAPLTYESSEWIKNYKSKFYQDRIDEDRELKE